MPILGNAQLNMSTLSTNDQGKSFENWSMAASTKSWLIINYDVVHFQLLCKEYLTLAKKLSLAVFCSNFREHFVKNCVIISAMAAKIWYLKNVRFLFGHPGCDAVKWM